MSFNFPEACRKCSVNKNSNCPVNTNKHSNDLMTCSFITGHNVHLKKKNSVLAVTESCALLNLEYVNRSNFCCRHWYGISALTVRASPQSAVRQQQNALTVTCHALLKASAETLLDQRICFPPNSVFGILITFNRKQQRSRHYFNNSMWEYAYLSEKNAHPEIQIGARDKNISLFTSG